MTKAEVYQLIAVGEGLHLDLKRSMDSKHAKTMVSFANTKGGKLVLGVEDDGTVNGHNLSNANQASIEQVARNCDPPVFIELESVDMDDGLKVTVISVPKSTNPPHRCTQGYFLRVGSESIKMSTEQLTAYLNVHGKLGFDERVRPEYQWKQVYSDAKIALYKSFLSQEAQALGDDIVLGNLGLVNNTHPTNAGLIFLSNEAVVQVPQFRVRCVAYNGADTGSDILDQKDFGEDLIQVIEDSVGFIKRHLNTAIKVVGLKSETTLEIPEEALREVVVNAVVHRDYNIKGANIKVEVFANRVEISSPGSLPSGMEEKELGKRSLARNADIANVLSRTPYMEKLGTGITRIGSAMRKANLAKAEYQVTTGFFTVVLKRPNQTSTPEAAEITPQVKALLKSMDDEMSRAEIMQLLELSDSKYVRESYIQPALNQGFIAMTLPDTPQSKHQKFKLTDIGLSLKKNLK